MNGKPLNDPIPDTLIDPSSGNVVSPPADGTPAMLDIFTLSRPNVSNSLFTSVTAPPAVVSGGSIVYSITVENDSPYPLNAVQVVVALPKGLEFDDTLNADTTLHNRAGVVMTIGRLVPGESRVLQLRTRAAEGQASGSTLSITPVVRSSTAQPVTLQTASTTIITAR